MTAEAFTQASVRGTYALAVIGHGGEGLFTGLGLLEFDGRGTVSGSFTENRPADRYGDRTIVTVPYRAMYTVDANGIGATTLPDGEQDSIFSIRQMGVVGVANGSRIAQELSVVFQRLDIATGTLKTGIATRLPDGAEFNNRSLRGRYVGASVSRGGQATAAGFGVLTYDGNGGFSESNVANVQGQSFRDRQLITRSDQGTYNVHADGTGVVADGGVLFVITRATLNDGVAIADEYAFFVRDLMPATGVLFTGITKRLSD
jgi:hypothetical protein